MKYKSFIIISLKLGKVKTLLLWKMLPAEQSQKDKVKASVIYKGSVDLTENLTVR